MIGSVHTVVGLYRRVGPYFRFLLLHEIIPSHQIADGYEACVRVGSLPTCIVGALPLGVVLECVAQELPQMRKTRQPPPTL